MTISSSPDITSQEACIFWGKFHADGPTCLPLAAHCLDVALVFRGLIQLPGIRRALASHAGTPLSDRQADRLAVLAMIHDAGKANLGFQRKVFSPKFPQAGHIRELAPLLDPEAYDEDLHMAFIEALSPDVFSWFSDDVSAYSYLMATFSHHGRPLAFTGEKSGTYFQARNEWWRPTGRFDPMAAVAEIMSWARKAFPAAFIHDEDTLPIDPRFHHRFAGLVMLADWLGSHSYWFPTQSTNLDERLRHGRHIVPRLLEAVGLDVAPLRPILSSLPQSFEARFGFKPRPLQATIDAIDPQDVNSQLVIAESETGSGKTEAALNWFFKLFEAGAVDGLYFALPTRVAARELYTRVQKTISQWFPNAEDRPVTLLAVPGYAQIDGVPPDRLLPSEEMANRWQDSADLRKRERQWAAEHPKRFLAATVAVGTIDQALLSCVQTAHAHLRSICLDRCLLVVDEVHASDTYMSRLLQFLLDHHMSVGGRAMLLSATLGAQARQQYIRSLRSKPLPDKIASESAPYPAMTLADGTIHPTEPTTTQKHVRFELIPFALEPEKTIEQLIAALQQGSRVLVVMNTVARAVSLQRALEGHSSLDPAWLFQCNGIGSPHHGRFAPQDRLVLDASISARLGRDSPEGPLILVGTQTLEQSLDIDADLLVTDLAPADVLLQRVGRLHRHRRSRPESFTKPICHVLVPEDDLESALDSHGEVAAPYKSMGYGSVYPDLRTLELTRHTLETSPEISIPRDNRRLVESATHPECLNSLSGSRWEAHGRTIEGGERAQTIAAGNATALFRDYFGELQFNEAGGKVATRLGTDSLQLPVEVPFSSPFGQIIKQIVLPGHMAPDEPDDTITVERSDNGITHLKCADKHYVYSRYGLEVSL